MKSNKKILLRAAIILLSLSIALILVGLGFVIFDYPGVSLIIFIVGSILGILGFVVTIIWGIKYMSGVPNNFVMSKRNKDIPIVDVKEVKETPEQKLYKQYEKLFKEGLITKEDLEKKKEELLKK